METQKQQASEQRESQIIWQRPDWFLQLLVSMVNKGDVTFPITLSVKGALITGQLVGGNQYINGFAEDFTTGFDTKAAEEVKSNFKQLGEKFYGKTDDENITLLSYIHLKSARILLAGGQMVPHNRPVWWRGRLTEVDGFAFGELRSEPA